MRRCDFLFFTAVAAVGAVLFVRAGCGLDALALLVLGAVVLGGSGYLIARTRRQDRGER